MWCQMKSRIPVTIRVWYITLSVPETMIMFSVMTPCHNELVSTPDAGRFSAWTLNTEHCTRNMNIERGRWTLNSEQGTWTVRRNSHDIVRSVPTPSFSFVFSHIPMNGTVLNIVIYRYCWLFKLCNINFAEGLRFDQCVTLRVYLFRQLRNTLDCRTLYIVAIACLLIAFSTVQGLIFICVYGRPSL